MELEKNILDTSELVEQAFDFWFGENGHLRSPFPDYIRPALRISATNRFYDWLNALNDEARQEFNDEMIAEKFEEIIFETAATLIKTEDERITILYPFMPRVDDEIRDADELASVITNREIYKEGDHTFMKVYCRRIEDNSNWDTSFELPF